MAVYRLNNWSVTESNNPYLPPEVSHKRLVGLRDADQKEVVTSPIVKIEGRNITTYSGSVYILDEIDQEYLRWMTANGYQYDPENPIKDKRLS